jgi:MoxR-like ATPase
MGYPEKAFEIEILDTHGAASPVDSISAVATAADVGSMVALAQKVHVAPSLKSYLVDLSTATRRHPRLTLGVSPRGTLALLRASRALAASQGREFVLPDDVKGLAAQVLEHRLMLTPEAQMGGTTQGDVLDEILASIAVPTARA